MKKEPEDLAEKIRRDMLRRAIARSPFNGNQAEFARQARRSSSQINDMLNKPGKSFGDKVARAIERNAGLPRYYLDGIATWPFQGIDPERYERLDEGQKREIEGAIRLLITQFEGQLDRQKSGNGL